jgi:glutamate-1-semialdehyde 2,1-aminomutase
VDPAVTTRVVELNAAAALERELAFGDVAAVLMEPALTNIGIVLPLPGYLDTVRQLTRRYGTPLINDETHTFSAGPGGCTAAWGLSPDMVTIGKAIAGGIPAGAYGLSSDLSERILADSTADIVDTGGIGGTLARYGVPWHITQLGARAEYRFCASPPFDGGRLLWPPIPNSTCTCTSIRSTGAC